MNHYVIDQEPDLFDQDYMATEDLLSSLNRVLTSIAAAWGHHNSMIAYINQHEKYIDNLDPNMLIRTIMPSDLELVDTALIQLNECLKQLRTGDPLELSKYTRALEPAGIDLRQDGKLYTERFRMGQWGQGKGKTALKAPMTFKKTVKEFGWGSKIHEFVKSFIDNVTEFTDRILMNSINRHYADLKRAYATASEKSIVKANKSVVVNQMKNIMSVRDLVIKFYFSQLKKVIAAGKEEQDAQAQESFEAMLLAVHPDTTPFE